MGGFFGGSVPAPPVQSPSTFGATQPAYGGFGAPSGSFPAAPSTARAASATRVPEAVTVACTLLGVFAAIGVFTVIAVVMLGSSDTGTSSDGSSANLGLGTVYAVLWGGSGFINAAAIVFLRQGNARARLLTSVLCGLWTLYWLRLLVKLADVGSSNFVFGGSVVRLGELFLLGLAVASALPAVVLWRGAARAHFD